MVEDVAELVRVDVDVAVVVAADALAGVDGLAVELSVGLAVGFVVAEQLTSRVRCRPHPVDAVGPAGAGETAVVAVASGQNGAQ